MRTALWALVALLGCDRGHPREGTPTPSTPLPPATATAPATACSITPIPLRYPAPKRLVAIGDLHGDLAATRAALRTAGAIDDKDTWIGGELVVVQTGDVLDRGDDEQAIFDLLFSLEAQAKAAGGAVLLLIGNHELMNAAGDFRYVTRGGAHDFGDRRVAALAPGGVYAKKIAMHNVIAIVGDTVFAHGGVIGEFATQVDEVNRGARCWLDGQAGGPDAQPPVVASEDSPVWTRAAGMPTGDCAALAASLKTLGVKRMVVGHTVQESGINAICDDTVWRIDVGLAKLYGGPIEVLELTSDAAPKVLRGMRI
ncbi:MAG: metallophosphoesterase [Myxococcales bacterium]|nr:metallophosphoesterase [Myxococcales bacterium]